MSKKVLENMQECGLDFPLKYVVNFGNKCVKFRKKMRKKCSKLRAKYCKFA